MRMTKVAAFYNLLATSLFTGATFAAWIAIYPTTQTLSATDYARIEQLFIRHFNPLMPLLGITAPICAAYLLIKYSSDRRTLPYLVFLAGFVFCLVTGIVSGPIDIPANKYVLSWSIQSPPADWMQTRDHLTAANHVRTLASMLALICYLTAQQLDWPKSSRAQA
jgi:uncharacterized membrane protein